MKTDAEVIPYNTRDPLDLTASTKEGRGALTDWLELGYVSQDRNTRCISRTVEYSFNDFAISQVAAGEKPEDQEKYLRRSAGWQNIWNRDVESLNFTGFLAPKFSNGTFNNSGYDPLYCYGCNWADLSYEGTPWGQFLDILLTTLTLTAVEYSFVVPHDTETLIDLMGGPETFEARLDLMVLLPISQRQFNKSNKLTSKVQTKHLSPRAGPQRRGHNNPHEHRVRPIPNMK